MIKAVFNWSGGKDSALALRKVLQESKYEVVSLLTTINRESKRSTMHDIPEALLLRQAQALGIPLYMVDVKSKGGMADYNEAMSRATNHFLDMGVRHFIFGDIFLNDVLSYRKSQLNPLGIEVVEPLWDIPVEKVMDEFIASGLKSVIVTVTEGVLSKDFIGRDIDRQMVEALPEGADPCGENGEYHSFCYDGDIFNERVEFSLGETVNKRFPIKLDDGTVKEFGYYFASLSL